MKNRILLSVLFAIFFTLSACNLAYAQSNNRIRQQCPAPNAGIFASVTINGFGDIVATPCPNRDTVIDSGISSDPTREYVYFNELAQIPQIPAGISFNLDPTINFLSSAGGGTGNAWQQSSAASVIDGSAFGVIEAVSGTGATSRLDIVSRNPDISNTFNGLYAYTHATRVQFATLPTAGENYTFFFGAFGTLITDPNFQRGVLFRYGNGINSDRIQTVCRDDQAAFTSANVDVGTDTITAANTMAANTQIVYTSSSTLPAPLTVETTYFVINPTPTTFQLSLTSGGAAIDLTTQGAANQWVSTSSYGDTGITPVINTWYKFRVELNAAATLAQFYIDNVAVGSCTTNISTGTSKRFTWELNNDKTAGTTSITTTRVDFFYFKRHSNVSRIY